MLFPELICILIAMLCADAAFWVIAIPRLRCVPGGALWRVLLSGFIIAQMLYLLAALLLPWELRGSGSIVPLWVHTQSYIWHMIVLPAVMLLVAAIWVLSKIFGRRKNVPRPASIDAAPSATKENALTRRQVLAATAFAAPPIIATVVGVRTVAQLREMRVRPFVLRIPSLPRQLDGMTITQVSDLHIGRFMRPDRLPHIIEKVNGLKSDFVVFTGDLIDLTLDDLPPGLDFLHKLKAPAGMAICEGNHDLVD
ncbi:MAG TPA: metallophosphoesterase, partial [Humisphaera sp.]|nr:metallophosphoesterase [Humisphaera sp.]